MNLWIVTDAKGRVLARILARTQLEANATAKKWWPTGTAKESA